MPIHFDHWYSNSNHILRSYILSAVVMFLFAFPAVTTAQSQVEVSGTVTDEQGQTMPAVNIKVKGSSKGTYTGRNGGYTMEVNASDTLIFSSMGFKSRTIPVEGRTTIDVTLTQSTQGLDEVVVTALGIDQVKEKIGYATQQVDIASINNVQAPNVANLFSGRIAGLTVTNPTGLFQSPDIKLRGKDPLIVIDGVPVQTDFFNISKSDIKSVNVLKGTSASALYGARGKDGAILITTKDASGDGLNVSLSTSTMHTAGYTVFPEVQQEYGNGSNGQYAFWDGAGGGVNDGDMIWGPKFEEGRMIPQWNSPIRDTQTGEIIEWYGSVDGTQYDDRTRYERVPIPWQSHNNVREFMRGGLQNQNEFAVSYSNDRGSYRFSGNYNYQQGRVPNTELSTGGASFANNYRITDGLTFDSRIAYNKVYSPNYPAYGYGPNNHIYTTLIWQGADVDPDDQREHQWVPGREGFRQANWNYAWYNNPYFAAEKRNQLYNEDTYRGQARLRWDVTTNLALQGRFAANTSTRFEDEERPKSYLLYGDPRDGFYKTWNYSDLNIENDLRIDYSRELSSNFNISAIGGYNSFTQEFEEYYNSTDGLVVPGVYSLSNTIRNVQGSTYRRKKIIRSLYSTIDLEFFSGVTLNLSGRNDWASTLPEDNNSYFYPSVALSTVVSNLVDLPDMFSYLKVYGSWAKVSSDLDPNFTNPYRLRAYYSKEGSFNGNPELTYPSEIANPDIRPQTTISREIGISTGFLDQRLNAEVTYYNILDKDQIINLPISLASGFSSRRVNGNRYKTNGLEVIIEATPVQQQNFMWSSTINWSRRVRRITEIYGDQQRFSNVDEDNVAGRLNGGVYYVQEGDRADSYYATGWRRSPSGEVILDAETGLPTQAENPQYKGHLLPDWRFGFQNNFRYKKFGLNIGIDGSYGGVMNSITVEKLWWGGKHPESTRWRDEEYAAGEPVYVPEGVNVVDGEIVRNARGEVIEDTRIFRENSTAVSWQTWAQNYPYRARVTEEESSLFANVFDRSFVKLRNLSLSYDLTSTLKNAGLGVSNARLTAFGYNLAILKAADIIDPDFGNDEELQDPSSRYVGLKLDLNF